jgi:methylmalonyl-CoA/ethylmalonyl-CoA epimerase
MKFLFDAGNMAFFQCGDIRFMIGTSHEAVTPGGTILYFKVLNIEQVHAQLASRGVAFTHAPQLIAKLPDRDLWMAFLNDPDGNAMALMSEVPRSS